MTGKLTIGRDELLQVMQVGAVVLTANTRLSRSLMSDYERAMLADGLEAWATPSVMPYPAWLQQMWEEASLYSEIPLERVLGVEQEAALWANVIADDHGHLLRPAATARRVANSWSLLHDWQLDLDNPSFGFQDDTLAFRRWARRFGDACRHHGVISGAELPHRLAPLLEGVLPDLPSRIMLMGFYQLTPAQQQFAESLNAAGVEVRWIGLEGRQGVVLRFKARDPRQEMQLAAEWARQRLEAQADTRVGIVVPDLSARRQGLERALREVLQPASLAPGASTDHPPWNISLGRTLSQYPVVDTALGLLSLTTGTVGMETLGSLLASPWWAMPDEAAGHLAELARRGLLDRVLRSQGEERVYLATVRNFSRHTDEQGELRPWASPMLARRLDALQVLRNELPRLADAAEWAHLFSDWLTSAGWRVNCRLDSTSYQAVERWQRLLSTMSGLDDYVTGLDLAAALALINRLAGEVIFQPQSVDAPVQVLGFHEANEQAFDHLWVMNLHDGHWPLPPAPDPFIPLRLQRERGLPGCDPERELEMARHITGHLATAAGQVVFSHPAAEGDEQLHCSPLIRDLSESSPDELLEPGRQSWRSLARQSASLVALPIDPPLALPEGRARGGSSILKNQSACSFKAFAEHRLGARPLEQVTAGLGPMRRGSLMHRVLEIFWKKTVTKDALDALAPDDLTSRVETCVDAAIEQQAARLRQQPRFADIEAGRLVEQTLAWLKVEKQRTPFRVIGFEQEVYVEVGGLSIRVFIDRVDALEDGRLVIIDYKTGKVSPAGWFGERPDDPQLPLYSRYQWEQPLAGVAFAQVRAEEVKFSGVVSGEAVLPDLPPKRKGELQEATGNWPQVLTDWSLVLDGLAVGYRAGQATLNPRQGTDTCRKCYCELAPLCRINTAVPEGAK